MKKLILLLSIILVGCTDQQEDVSIQLDYEPNENEITNVEDYTTSKAVLTESDWGFISTNGDAGVFLPTEIEFGRHKVHRDGVARIYQFNVGSVNYRVVSWFPNSGWAAYRVDRTAEAGKTWTRLNSYTEWFQAAVNQIARDINVATYDVETKTEAIGLLESLGFIGFVPETLYDHPSQPIGSSLYFRNNGTIDVNVVRSPVHLTTTFPLARMDYAITTFLLGE